MVNPEGVCRMNDAKEKTLDGARHDQLEEQIPMVAVVDGARDDQLGEQTPLMAVVDPSQPGDCDDAEVAADVTTVKKSNLDFQSLTKDQLQQFVNNPFWKRARLIVFILFWVVWFAMLAAVIIIIVLSPKCPPRPTRQFWQKPFYRLQVKSFAPASDADPTAAGSIEGLVKKMDYLCETLGFRNFILDSLVSTHVSSKCPVDFQAMNSSLGSLHTLKSLTKHGRKKGFNFLMEFDASQVDMAWPHGAGTDAFVTAANASSELPKLASRNGGLAWFDGRLHLPRGTCLSLNATSPTVLGKVEDALAFWLDAGLSGFVLTNVAFMSPTMRAAGLTGENWFDADPTPLLFSNDSVRFVRSIRRFINAEAEKRGVELALFVDPGNTGFPQPEAQLAAYLDPAAGAHAVISTSLGAPLSPLARKEPRLPAQVIQDTLKAVGDSGSVLFPTAWPSMRRSGESFWAALSLVLPGVPCLYYGQELGMTHVSGLRLLGLTSYLAGLDSTDASESPMQWSDSPVNAGWLANDTTPLAWCNLEPRAADIERRNLRRLSSAGHPASELQLVQALVKLVSTKESLQWGRLTLLKAKGSRLSGDVIAFKREAERYPPVLVVVNAANKSATLELDLRNANMLKGTLKVMHSSEPGAQSASSYEVEKEYSIAEVFAPAKSVLVFLGAETV